MNECFNENQNDDFKKKLNDQRFLKLIPLELIHIFVLSIDIAVYLPLQLEVRYE
jgi:hypothetical protein